jgi:hypothetical protein
MDVKQRMGEPVAVAVAAAVAHRGWVRRHPLLVFGLAPLPAVLLAVACYVLAFAGLGYAVSEAAGTLPEGIARPAADAVFSGIAFVPFLAVSGGLGWLAVRSGAGLWWAGAALAQVVLLAGLVRVQSTWSALPGQSTLVLGVGLPLTGWRPAAQMLLPLALGWLTLRRRRPQPCAVA